MLYEPQNFLKIFKIPIDTTGIICYNTYYTDMLIMYKEWFL